MSRLLRHAYDPKQLLVKARMISRESQLHTFFVEGKLDRQFLEQWLNGKFARVEIAGGKGNVELVYKKAKELPFTLVHCLVDLDYDLVVGSSPIIDQQFIYISMDYESPIVSGECNDLESLLVRSTALTKMIEQKYPSLEPNKANFPTCVNQLREKLRIAARDVGAFRAADAWSYKKRCQSPIGGDFRINEIFFDSNTLTVDIKSLERSLLRSTRTTTTAMEDVVERAYIYRKEYDTGWELCRGHDLTEILSQHLSKKFNNVITREKIEEYLCLSCDSAILKETCFGKRLSNIGKELGLKFLKSC